MSKAEAVRAQVEALGGWISELDNNFDDDLDRVVPFDYSPGLADAMDLYGIADPEAARTVFSVRAEALKNVLARL